LRVIVNRGACSGTNGEISEEYLERGRLVCRRGEKRGAAERQNVFAKE